MIGAGTKPQLSNVFEMSQFTSMGKLLRTLAWVLRFIKNLKSVFITKPLNLEQQVSAIETEDDEQIFDTIRSVPTSCHPSEGPAYVTA